jgi:predicted phage terminase large subunit-like protein
VDYPHLVYLRNVLERVTTGEIKRLMVLMPPRHGKSENLTVRYPVFRLEREPKLRTIIAAYNHGLATKFSRKARRIAEGRFALATDRSAADDWETPQGGGVRSVGVGGGVTGTGADLIFIDDPVKSREEAQLEVYREKVWDWYRDDIYTRLEPGGTIVLIMTRWHENDLAGKILGSEQGSEWTVVQLPAIAEEGDLMGRSIGEALCPERYDIPALDDIRRTQGESSFGALYQQRPTSREGSFFKPANFGMVEAAPAGLRYVRAWDTAATEDGGDFTVGVKLGVDAEGSFYVVDVVRGQWDTSKRNRVIRATAERDGISVLIRGAQDPGAAGVDSKRAFFQLLAGFRVTTEPFSAQVNGGNVKLIRGAWNREFLEELRAFPRGKHDDQVDAAADAFNALCIPALEADTQSYRDFWNERDDGEDEFGSTRLS